MKFCPNCGSGIADEATFCPTCGNPVAASVPQPAPQPAPYSYQQPNYGYQPAPAPAPVVDPTDHTAEFDAADISDNKIVAMLIYLGGYLGIFVALLMANTSKYVSFQVRQALKLEVVSLLFLLCAIPVAVCAIIPVLGWIVAVVYGLAAVAFPITLLVIKIMAFVNILKGKVKEPALIHKLSFLK